jgi:hypothetical protein
MNDSCDNILDSCRGAEEATGASRGLLAAANHPFPERRPGSAVRNASAERPRYDCAWE